MSATEGEARGVLHIRNVGHMATLKECSSHRATVSEEDMGGQQFAFYKCPLSQC